MADIQIITKTDYGYLQKQATLAYPEINFQETIQQQGLIEGGGHQIVRFRVIFAVNEDIRYWLECQFFNELNDRCSLD